MTPVVKIKVTNWPTHDLAARVNLLNVQHAMVTVRNSRTGDLDAHLTLTRDEAESLYRQLGEVLGDRSPHPPKEER